MKTKLVYILLITLLIANMVLLFLLTNKPNHHKPPFHFLVEQLDLDKKQLEKFNEFKEIHHQKMQKIDRETKQLKNRFFKSISDKKNTINSDSIADLIGVNEAEKNIEVFSFFKHIRSVCNDKQKNKLDHLILQSLPEDNQGLPPPR